MLRSVKEERVKATKESSEIIERLGISPIICKGDKTPGCQAELCPWYFSYSPWREDKLHPYCDFCMAEEYGELVAEGTVRVRKTRYLKRLGEIKPSKKDKVQELLSQGYSRCQGQCGKIKPPGAFKIATLAPSGRHHTCKRCQLNQRNEKAKKEEVLELKKEKKRIIKTSAQDFKPGMIWCKQENHWVSPDMFLGNNKICLDCD